MQRSTTRIWQSVRLYPEIFTCQCFIFSLNYFSVYVVWYYIKLDCRFFFVVLFDVLFCIFVFWFPYVMHNCILVSLCYTSLYFGFPSYKSLYFGFPMLYHMKLIVYLCISFQTPWIAYFSWGNGQVWGWKTNQTYKFSRYSFSLFFVKIHRTAGR